MKEMEKTPKNWISIRVKPEEYNTIYNFFRTTTCNKLSEYVRKVLLKKPVIVNYRNEGAAEILSALNQIKKELSAIGNNFNQTVHKLHTLDHIPEIKVWVTITESSRQILLKKVEEIRITMHQINEKCARK